MSRFERVLREPGQTRRTTEVLADLIAGDPDGRIAIADLVHALHDRAFGLLILVFALPNAIPGPIIPGLSAVLGAPIVLLGAQMMRGQADPWLPRRVLKRSFRRGDYARFMLRALPWLERFERLFRPRLAPFTGATADRWVGLLMAVYALVLTLPIPLANLVPAWAIVLIAMGLIESDGLAVLTGAVLGALGTIWAVFLVLGGFKLLQALF